MEANQISLELHGSQSNRHSAHKQSQSREEKCVTDYLARVLLVFSANACYTGYQSNLYGGQLNFSGVVWKPIKFPWNLMEANQISL